MVEVSIVSSAIGTVIGFVSAWIWKSHPVHEAISEIKRLYLALEQAREREERLRRMIRLLCERFGYMGEMMFSPEDWAAIRKEVEG